jgi:hypothetical protein
MCEAEDEVQEDSDFHPNNEPETDHVEDGKTILKGKLKIFLPEYKEIFAENPPCEDFHRKEQSKFIDLVPGTN